MTFEEKNGFIFLLKRDKKTLSLIYLNLIILFEICNIPTQNHVD